VGRARRAAARDLRRTLIFGLVPVRLFLAIDPGPALAARLRDELAALRAHAPYARWVSHEAVHATLVFLGELDDAAAPEVIDASARVAAAHAPMIVRARGGGTFGGRRARVLWIGLEGQLDAVRALRRDLEQALAPLGHVPEARDFAPHLTLARARAGGDPALAACAARVPREDLGGLATSTAVLYRSELGRGGARYTALARLPLRGAA
jgi:2'-5' RNA ligase